MTPNERLNSALALLRIDPQLGGMVLRARSGAVYQAALDLVAQTTALPITRLHPSMGMETLDGGIDVASSLAKQTIVQSRGVLDGTEKALVLPMAERAEPLLVSRLTKCMDEAQGHLVFAMDEGADPDETCSDALKDRLAFHIDLSEVHYGDIAPPEKLGIRTVSEPSETVAENLEATLVGICDTLGIESLRAASLALRVIQANLVLEGRSVANAADLDLAVHLVLAPRATKLPAQMEEPPEDVPDDNRNETQQDTSTSLSIPDDILLQAIEAVLPPDVLQGLSDKGSRSAQGNGSGRKRIGNRRGRPLPARNGSGNSSARIDLMATLRAAVPFQTLRRAAKNARKGPIIFPNDIRYKRFNEHSDRLLIFVVDASGSAAIARLAEAKGAVELLLSQAYARRDHVSLISFRGKDAETLLPPTRSLVQTKRRLADLPGGGGTPLAAGLKHALETVHHAQKKGLTPTIVLLTDGRSNVALDGTGDRTLAASDARTMASLCAQSGTDAIVIDTGRRPEPSLNDLASTLRANYVSLPRADAQSLSNNVTQHLNP